MLLRWWPRLTVVWPRSTRLTGSLGLINPTENLGRHSDLVVPTGWRQWGRSMDFPSLRHMSLKGMKGDSASRSYSQGQPWSSSPGQTDLQDGNLKVDNLPSFEIRFATAPSTLANWPPFPRVISKLCMDVPKGIYVEVDSSFFLKKTSQNVQDSSKAYDFLDVYKNL
jgi:hypothetical protein